MSQTWVSTGTTEETKVYCCKLISRFIRTLIEPLIFLTVLKNESDIKGSKIAKKKSNLKGSESGAEKKKV